METRHPQLPRTTNSPEQDTRTLGAEGRLSQRISRFRSQGAARQAFTIVELLIVVVVIAILVAVTLVAYNGITANAKDSALKADLNTTAKKVGIAQAETGSYPSSAPADLPDTIQYSQTSSGQGFCATASKDGRAFHITESGVVQTGACSGHTVGGGGGTLASMQSFTSAQCGDLTVFTGSNASAVIQLTDSRGGTTRTYEIAKLADNKCWMLTNLKLGSTSNTVTLTSADSDVASNFTLPQLTTVGAEENDLPRAYGPVPGDTGSGATNYGYLYNWSAATAGATRTSNPAGSGNAEYSICPANWRLPTGGGGNGNDFGDLDIAFGGSGQTTWGEEPNVAAWQLSGPFRGLLTGYWGEGTFQANGSGNLWSSSAHAIHATNAHFAGFELEGAYQDLGDGGRVNGFGIRCLINSPS